VGELTLVAFLAQLRFGLVLVNFSLVELILDPALLTSRQVADVLAGLVEILATISEKTLGIGTITMGESRLDLRDSRLRERDSQVLPSCWVS
jgi:hypothetical protein